MPPSNRLRRAKIDALLGEGTLNPAPEKVRDPKFRQSEFFDPCDVVQVRYEMLRRVLIEKFSVTDVAGEYGVSRPTFYQAKTGFETAGMAGLVPKKRGPHGRHKLRDEVMSVIEQRLVPGEPLRARALALRLREELGLEVHPRTIERAVKEKKTA